MEKRLTPGARYQANPQFILREVAGSAVLVPVGDCGALSNSMLSLNETSALLWKLFQTPATIEETAARVRQTYSAEEGRIEAEIAGYVLEYLNLHLLEEVHK